MFLYTCKDVECAYHPQGRHTYNVVGLLFLSIKAMSINIINKSKVKGSDSEDSKDEIFSKKLNNVSRVLARVYKLVKVTRKAVTIISNRWIQ